MKRTLTPPHLLTKLQAFFKLEASGGVILVLMAALALIIANSSLYPIYDYILHHISFTIGFSDVAGKLNFEIQKPILLWVNDGLMTIFFLLVGLEIKREFALGEFSDRARATLPILGALGGITAPALIYAFININAPSELAGWAIPTPTDIAFALGVLALLGARVPLNLKILLLGIAVMDDLAAIAIIAFFYTDQLSVMPILLALLCLAGMVTLKLKHIENAAPYLLIGLIMWASVLQSGVHATLAGVVTAFFIPMHNKKAPKTPPCETLINGLHPWVAFLVLPVFALTNAGVPLNNIGLHSFLEPVTLGIIAGLVIGKQIGIFGVLFLTIKTGLCPMPKNCTWLQLYGLSVLCGIGFTMSLFIGGLAFDDLAHQAAIRLGVIVGSVISACLGAAILYFAPPAKPQHH